MYFDVFQFSVVYGSHIFFCPKKTTNRHKVKPKCIVNSILLDWPSWNQSGKNSLNCECGYVVTAYTTTAPAPAADDPLIKLVTELPPRNKDSWAKIARADEKESYLWLHSNATWTPAFVIDQCLPPREYIQISARNYCEVLIRYSFFHLIVWQALVT